MKTYGWQIGTLKHAHHHWIMLLSHFQSCPTPCDPQTPRRQPTRLPRPWDPPSKNTAVGCHFLLQCMKVKKSESEVAQSNSEQPHGLQPTRVLRPWDFPGKSTGVGCHRLLRLDHKGNANHTTRTHCCLHTRMTTIKKKTTDHLTASSAGRTHTTGRKVEMYSHF